MIFVGDIALGHQAPFEMKRMPDNMHSGLWFGNLEGPVFVGDLAEQAIFNSPDSINRLIDEYDIVAFSLANNHIKDVGYFNASESLSILDEKGIIPVGLGKENDPASFRCVVQEEGNSIIILNYGWSVIGCDSCTKSKLGCVDIDEDKILLDIARAKEEFPKGKVVVYLHWGIELEVAPQPYHRQLAHRMVDAGVDIVLGCHAHRLQGAELYQGKPIVYGLGNWMFSRCHFWAGQLDYPEVCNLQLAVDWCPKTGVTRLELFEYMVDEVEILRYIKTVSIDEVNELTSLPSFKDMSMNDYARAFANLRVKRKLLPIYQHDDGVVLRTMKDKWIKIRHKILMAIKAVAKYFKI